MAERAERSAGWGGLRNKGAAQARNVIAQAHNLRPTHRAQTGEGTHGRPPRVRPNLPCGSEVTSLGNKGVTRLVTCIAQRGGRLSNKGVTTLFRTLITYEPHAERRGGGAHDRPPRVRANLPCGSEVMSLGNTGGTRLVTCIALDRTCGAQRGGARFRQTRVGTFQTRAIHSVEPMW